MANPGQDEASDEAAKEAAEGTPTKEKESV